MSSAPQPKRNHPAVIRLAEGTALAQRIAAERPPLVVDALLGGASPQEITAVLGWDVEDLRVAINKWAPRLHRAGKLTEQGFIDLMNVVFGSTG